MRVHSHRGHDGALQSPQPGLALVALGVRNKEREERIVDKLLDLKRREARDGPRAVARLRPRPVLEPVKR